jgi:hypothetical protein
MGSFLSSEENQNDDNENTGGGFGLNDSEKEYTDSDYLMEEIPVKRSSKKGKTRNKKRSGGKTRRSKY